MGETGEGDISEIVEYKIIQSSDATDLEIRVGKSIKQGFQPFGNLAVTCYTRKTFEFNVYYEYNQPMVKVKP